MTAKARPLSGRSRNGTSRLSEKRSLPILRPPLQVHAFDGELHGCLRVGAPLHRWLVGGEARRVAFEGAARDALRLLGGKVVTDVVLHVALCRGSGMVVARDREMSAPGRAERQGRFTRTTHGAPCASCFSRGATQGLSAVVPASNDAPAVAAGRGCTSRSLRPCARCAGIDRATCRAICWPG